MFKKYKFGSWKREIRNLLKKRIDVKDRIRYHLGKIEHHENKIKTLKKKILPGVEKELEKYLKRAGNP